VGLVSAYRAILKVPPEGLEPPTSPIEAARSSS
jgi:hypothetical protein